MDKYYGISYPEMLDNEQFHNLFKSMFCPKGFHLFDEVLSDEEHMLYCDACGLMIHIASIEKEE